LTALCGQRKAALASNRPTTLASDRPAMLGGRRESARPGDCRTTFSGHCLTALAGDRLTTLSGHCLTALQTTRALDLRTALPGRLAAAHGIFGGSRVGALGLRAAGAALARSGVFKHGTAALQGAGAFLPDRQARATHKNSRG